MKRANLMAGVVVGAAMGMAAGSLWAQNHRDKLIERGDYLVNRATVCSDCHTPRDDKGQWVRERWLQGAVLDFEPTRPIPNWAAAAPGIAGLPGLQEADAIQFLETGLKPTGQMARPPMPPYRFSREDAEAIVAYLKSLQSADK